MTLAPSWLERAAALLPPLLVPKKGLGFTPDFTDTYEKADRGR
jgi:hypothetical protein